MSGPCALIPLLRPAKLLMHTTHIDHLPADYRKALSAFTFGSQGFILARLKFGFAGIENTTIAPSCSK